MVPPTPASFCWPETRPMCAVPCPHASGSNSGLVSARRRIRYLPPASQGLELLRAYEEVGQDEHSGVAHQSLPHTAGERVAERTHHAPEGRRRESCEGHHGGGDGEHPMPRQGGWHVSGPSGEEADSFGLALD